VSGISKAKSNFPGKEGNMGSNREVLLHLKMFLSKNLIENALKNLVLRLDHISLYNSQL
jgi:hypothetical protein